MRRHTDAFKTGMIQLGREHSVLISYEDTILTNNNITSINYHYESDILKSIMTGVEFESYDAIPKGTTINLNWGIKVGDEYEYLDFGTFTIYSSEFQEDSKTYRLIAYDGMLASMKDYVPIQDLDYPCTVKTYLNSICEAIGVSFSLETTFTNSDNLLQTDPYSSIDDDGTKKSLGYTYRDILDDIAEATGTNIIIKNGELLLRTFQETNDTLPPDFIKTTSTKFKTYGPINAVVLSRSTSDNIYARDVESIEENGLYEIKITDNQILNGNNRNTYINGIYDALHGLRYTLCDFSTGGVAYYEPLDMFSVQIDDTTYNNIVMLNDELVVKDGINENIHVDEPTSSETDYTKADTTDIRLNQTTLIVDKQNQQIQGLITNTSQNTENISSLTQTVSGFDARISQASTDADNASSKVAQLSADVSSLRSEIGEVTDTTVHEKGYGSLEFHDINQSYPVQVKIHPMADSDIAYLYPCTNLFPSDTRYLKNRKLRFTNTQTNEIWEYILPDNLRYYNANIYDEFIMDFGTGGDTSVCQITKKVGISADGTKSALVTEEITQYSFPLELTLTDGDYVVELLGYPNAYLDVTLMSKNMYTSQFTTKVEMNSKITQKADEITTEVQENYATIGNVQELSSRVTQNQNSITSEVTNRQNEDNALSSRITQTADSLTSEITNRQNGDNALSSRITQNTNNIETKVSKGSIVSTINQSAEAVKINANKISLEGKEINLTADNTTIKSTNFNVDKNGNLSCVGGTFTNGNILLTSDALGKGRSNFQITRNGGYVALQEFFNGIKLSNDSAGISITTSIGNASNNVTGGIDMYYNNAVVLSISVDETGVGNIQVGRYGSQYSSISPNRIKTTGDMYANAYLYNSKEEIKQDIAKYNKKALDIIQSTDVYEFNYKNSPNKKKTIGFVIGENYRTADEIISNTQDSITSYSVMGLLWKAIQEQQQQIEELKQQVKELKEGS